MEKPIVKKLSKTLDDKREIAKIYFSILSCVGKLNLAERELELLSYLSTKGTISSVSAKSDFIKIYNISIPTLNNVISKLYKKKLLIKDDGRIRINPKIYIDFNTSDEFKFLITCLYKGKELKVE